MCYYSSQHKQTRRELTVHAGGGYIIVDNIVTAGDFLRAGRPIQAKAEPCAPVWCTSCFLFWRR